MNKFVFAPRRHKDNTESYEVKEQRKNCSDVTLEVQYLPYTDTEEEFYFSCVLYVHPERRTRKPVPFFVLFAPQIRPYTGLALHPPFRAFLFQPAPRQRSICNKRDGAAGPYSHCFLRDDPVFLCLNIHRNRVDFLVGRRTEKRSPTTL